MKYIKYALLAIILFLLVIAIGFGLFFAVKLNAANKEIDKLEKRLSCNALGDIPNFTPNYSSNSEMSTALKELIGEARGSVVNATWDILWTDSKTAIHKVSTSESMDVFIVYFDEPDFSKESIYWANRQCWLELDVSQTPVIKSNNTAIPSMATPAPASTPVPPSPVKLDAHNVGEIVQMDGRNITLNSAQVADGIVTANITIENISTEVLSVRPPDFTAKDGGGTVLESTYECDQQLRADLAPGDNVRGNLCWSGASGNTFKFQYSFYDDDYNTIIAVWSVTIE